MTQHSTMPIQFVDHQQWWLVYRQEMRLLGEWIWDISLNINRPRRWSLTAGSRPWSHLQWQGGDHQHEALGVMDNRVKMIPAVTREAQQLWCFSARATSVGRLPYFSSLRSHQTLQWVFHYVPFAARCEQWITTLLHYMTSSRIN